MPFTITAVFPLGFYQGQNPAGQVEEVPTPLRLFSALVAAAGTGSLAVEADGELDIAIECRKALEWLEVNPPDEIALPERVVNRPGVTAFKKLGLRTRGRFDVPTAKEAIARSSLNGPVHWRWSAVPPEEVREALEQLVTDVPYLGEAASPVVMSASNEEFELHEPYVRLESNGAFPDDPAALTFQVPAEGRLALLESLHRELTKQGRSNPSSKNEDEDVARWPDRALRQVWYAPPRAGSPHPNPWPEAFIIELGNGHSSGGGWPPQPRDYVRWCVALHRTLVKAIGQDVPAVLTGRYEPGTYRPANHVAIQLLRRDDRIALEWTAEAQAAFAVLIPEEIGERDRAAVHQALTVLPGRTIRPSRSQSASVINVHYVEVHEFWEAPPAEHKRFWVTRPLAITDTRPLKQNANAEPWSLADAARLSIGMTWREQFKPTSKGERLYQELAAAAGEQANVLSGRRVHDQELHRFVHRAHENSIVTAYRAVLDLGGLLAPTAPAAIGQSRHLGGGLLVPLDVPVSLLGEDGNPAWF